MKKIAFLLMVSIYSFAQTGIGTTTPVNKFQVETTVADPLTSGSLRNGHLRLSGTGFTHAVDAGLMSTTSNFGTWIQARKRDDYSVNYNLLLNPNGGNVGIGTSVPSVRLQVSGDIIANSIAGSSDLRFKANITPIVNPLQKVMALRGVHFNWNTEAFPQRMFSDKRTLGFIAQEVEKVLPEIVQTENTAEGYKSVQYDKVVALLVEAMKEQQKQINQLKKEIKKLKSHSR